MQTAVVCPRSGGFEEKRTHFTIPLAKSHVILESEDPGIDVEVFAVNKGGLVVADLMGGHLAKRRRTEPVHQQDFLKLVQVEKFDLVEHY